MFVYRAVMADWIPAGLPDAARDAAQSSVAGALAAAEGLSGPLGLQLIDTARDAFTLAVRAGFGVGALILAPVAVAVLVLLHRTDPPVSDPVPEGA